MEFYQICKTCKVRKLISEFSKSNSYPGGYRYECKECRKVKTKKWTKDNLEKLILYNKNYIKEHPEKQKAWNKKNYEKRKDWASSYQKEYGKKNKERLSCRGREYYNKHRNEKLIYANDYAKTNREKINTYTRERRKTNLNYKIRCNLSTRINKALNRKNLSKSIKTQELIGCSISELRIYLESKFLLTMNWKNYGPLWQVDHIIPCDSFDLTKEEEQRKCFHYTNLQPLFKVTTIINGIEYIGNINKGNKII